MRLTRSVVQLCILAMLACSSLAGCSVYMAANQPDKKDMGVLKSGTPRSVVVAELGAPVETITRGGAKVDLFTFVQGYSGLEKGGRAVLHGPPTSSRWGCGRWSVRRSRAMPTARRSASRSPTTVKTGW